MKIIVFVCSLIFFSFSANAFEPGDIGISDKIGNSLPLDAKFLDENGRSVLLGDYFKDDKPVILALVYYGCPSLCTVVLNGFIEGLNESHLDPIGQTFRVLSISIDPSEKPEIAKVKREAYFKELKNIPQDNSWTFLTGDEANIQKTASALGFGYKLIDGEYAHGAGIFAVSPQGVLKRVLYGSKFSAQSLKIALIEAGSGNVGNIVDKVTAYFLKYDSLERKYKPHMVRLIKLFGALMLLNVILVVYRRKSIKI